MKKNYIFLIIVFVIITSFLAFFNTKSNAEIKNGKISIVTTIFPEYDWVKQILGDKANNFEITMLMSNGVDLHSYQPTAEDIIKISGCDMFVYVGGESDEWAKKILKNANNPKIKAINLLEILGDKVKSEELVEGMEHEHHDHEHHDHEHMNEDEEEHEHEHEDEIDEHVWLSLKNAKVICNYISRQICELDSQNKEIYEKNLKNYIDSLEVLDKEYAIEIGKSKNKTLVFGDRFPFRYLTDDYNLKYFAAFTGCSSESEASFETIVFLSNKINELNLKSIMQIETSDGSIPRTIKESTKTKDQKILKLNSMQSVTSNDVAKGATYISIMKSNLEVLKEALQ